MVKKFYVYRSLRASHQAGVLVFHSRHVLKSKFIQKMNGWKLFRGFEHLSRAESRKAEW